jgi:hypothetical protein
MPLDVTLLGPDGAVLDRVQKASDGALNRQFSSAIGLEE